MYDIDVLQSMSRKELQKLCKQVGVKANKKNNELVVDLHQYFCKEENNLLELEKAVKASDAEGCPSSAPAIEQECGEKLKDKLMEEVERRAAEKLSMIPRFAAKGITVPKPADKLRVDFSPHHQKEFKKMDSIDVYMKKKQKRSEEADKLREQVMKAKENAQSTLKKMKQSHNTPGDVERQKGKISKSTNSKRLSFKSPSVSKSPGFQPRLHIDTNISFSLPKSPKAKLRTSPRLSSQNKSVVSSKLKSSLKVVSSSNLSRKSVAFSDVKGRLSTGNIKPLKRLSSGAKPLSRASSSKSKTISRASTGSTKTTGRVSTESTKPTGRVSTGGCKPAERVSTGAAKENRLSVGNLTLNTSSMKDNRKTMFDFRSPGTATKKTPVKFDLKASLKKGLSYKPHTGKLKPVDSTYQAKGPQSKPRVALKEMKNVGLRDKRRVAAAERRGNKKETAMNQKRGVRS